LWLILLFASAASSALFVLMPASEMANVCLVRFFLLFCCPFCSFTVSQKNYSKSIHTHTTKKHSLLRDDTTHFIRRETMSNDGSTNASLFFVAGSCVGMLVRRSFFFYLVWIKSQRE
jgi:hypothetical protein